MKIIKNTAVAVIGAASLIMPLGLGAVAHAQQAPLQVTCTGVGGEFPFSTTEGCDLSVDKQVSVNGGAFVEADTSADAAQAQVGDTITWKIILTNNSSEGLTPHGTVYISDVLPSGVTYGSSSASAGSYITSGFFANDWFVPLLNSDSMSNLPATLTLTTTSNATGLFQNTATLVKYDNGSCDGGCTYSDSNPDNDSNDAWIDPSAPPAVLGSSTTLANTGTGAAPSLIAGGLIVATLTAGLIGRNRHYKIGR